MIKYIIFHPSNGCMNHNCVRNQFSYGQVATLLAHNLEEAFRLSQNDFSKEYSALGIRSTSVGDIIVDIRNEKHYFVKGVGFEEIPHTVTSYIDWGEHLEELRNECELNGLENQGIE